jgi:hypothetical protein
MRDLGCAQEMKVAAMNEALVMQVAAYRSRLEALVRRGLDVRDALAAEGTNPSATAAARTWQQDCGVVVNELSGASKAHWLARAFSEAFLVRQAAGPVVEDISPAEIVQRLIGVLEQGLASLSQDDVALSPAGPPAPHRFDFVNDPEIRPILEQAYTDGASEFEAGHYDVALRTYCGMIEAIVTDALQDKGLSALRDAPEGEIAQWSFETRLRVAEMNGLIGRGFARLPESARKYREIEHGSKAVTSERDARLAGQVLHVMMRDLNPGR